MDKKDEIIRDLKRVAKELGKNRLSISQYRKTGKFSLTTIRRSFASWTRATRAAGLRSCKGYLPSRAYAKSDLMDALVELTLSLKRPPSRQEMVTFGKYSAKPFIRCWGSFGKAKEIAFEKAKGQNPELARGENAKPKVRKKRQKSTHFGEPLNLPGARHAPTNELGVIYLFGILSKDLGFAVESIRSEFPDCRAKRAVDNEQKIWEPVLIEFEYKSSSFRDHGHNAGECDLIICWENDWPECPLEVLELRKIVAPEGQWRS